MRSATPLMRSAEPTDVPPYFWTIEGHLTICFYCFDFASSPRTDGRHVVPILGSKAGDDALHVLGRSVLAELELGLDPADSELHPDDRPQLAVDVRLRRIVDRPSRISGGFVLAGQGADVPLHPIGVVVDGQLAVDMGRYVVPCRDHAAVLALRLVPGRRDVRVRTANDGHRLAQDGLLPVVVLAREVAAQQSVLAGLVGAIRLDVDHRQHRRPQAVGRSRNQVHGAVVAQELADGLVVGLEVFGDVHGAAVSRFRDERRRYSMGDIAGLRVDTMRP